MEMLDCISSANGELRQFLKIARFGRASAIPSHSGQSH